MTPRKLLIDTDPGTDDLIALLMALRSPELEVVGVTTVGGNARLAHTTRNALRILEHIGRADVPVAPGASRPLRGRFTYAYDFHGPAGLTARLPLPQTRPTPGRASDFIYRTLAASPGRVSILALGPLTNLARLLRKHPGAKRLMGELVVMGGAVGVPGNVTPHAEFNVFNDPLAAQEVLASGIPITLVDLRVCRQALFRKADLARLGGKGRAAELALRVLKGWFRLHPKREAYDLCDPLATGVLLDPTLVTTEAVSLGVDVSDGPERGKTYVAATPGPVHVTREVDAERFKELMFRLLA
ncbi:MAG: nucleoside hydrolase [Chloroflexota bacterium]|nr:nucleoside hydrolase [Chloroflexota bacterium]